MWKFKELFDENIRALAASNNRLVQELNYISTKRQVKFDDYWLKQDNIEA